MTNSMTPYNGGDDIDGYVADGTQTSGAEILITFTKDEEWKAGDEAIDPDRCFIITNTTRVVIKRVVDKNGKLRTGETIPVGSGQPWPDVAAMNAAAPRSEWIANRFKNDALEGPFTKVVHVSLLDPASLDQYIWKAYLTTIGSAMAVDELVKKIKNYRKLYGSGWCPRVTLSDTPMRTQYGGRQRPHFDTGDMDDWVNMSEARHALAAPDTKLLPSGVADAAPAVEAAPAVAPEVVEVKAEEVAAMSADDIKRRLKGRRKLSASSFAS